jgi:hypothetical protein
MKLLVSLLLISIFSGCNNNDVDEFLPITISTTLVASGNLYGNGKENITRQNLIIQSNKEWTELMNKMNSANNVTDNFTGTEIDFSNFIILAFFDEIKMNGGYTIEIAGVVENRNDLTVNVRHLSPNGIVPTVITQPYCIVKIPKTEKKIVFNNQS